MFSQETGFLMRDYSVVSQSKIDVFLDEYFCETRNPVIHSDKHFKINENPKCVETYTQTEQNKKLQTTLISDNLSTKLHTDPKCNILRVKCTYINKKSVNDVNKNNVEGVTDNEDWNKYNNDTKTDLQKILVMMALSSQTETVEKVLTSHNENILSNPSKKIIESEIDSVHFFGNTYNNCKDVTDILNITSMRIEIIDRQKRLLKKYTEKWKKYVNKKKEFWSQQRQNTLNTFFDKLKKKKIEIKESSESVNKVKRLTQDYSTYQHRYKVQKHVIALQKAKLEEQTRLIEELKYNKIVEASRQSVCTMREEVRKAYHEIDRQLKPKIKCLTNELKIPEIDQSSLLLQCMKVPQFLQRMEKRAREREEKHAMIRERRRQMEEERVRMKQQDELAKIEMDKEEKLKRIEELRDKRKKEKIVNIRRKQFAERIRALIVMADLHYEKYLMAKYGIKPLKRLIEIKQDNIELAEVHYKYQVKKNVFLHFMWYTEDMVFERNYKAEDFYRKKVLSKAFKSLKQMHYEYVCKRQVAEDYYDLYVTQLIFRKLREAIEQLRKEYEIKWHKVVAYYTSNLLFKTFTCWRTLPALNELMRQQETRKARWREKVLQVVPDYTPPED